MEPIDCDTVLAAPGSIAPVVLAMLAKVLPVWVTPVTDAVPSVAMASAWFSEGGWLTVGATS